MRNLIRLTSIAMALALAAPALGNDASDTMTEKKADVRKSARDLKPGEKTASDRAEDAKDTARASAAKGRKQARKGKRKAKKTVHDATK